MHEQQNGPISGEKQSRERVPRSSRGESRPAGKAVCDRCGGTFGRRGMGSHRRSCRPAAVVPSAPRDDDAQATIRRLREELTRAYTNNHARNVELDALHYVWCDGGCEDGIHRFSEHPPLSREIVEAAIRNTERLVQKYNNMSYRAAWKVIDYTAHRMLEDAWRREAEARRVLQSLRERYPDAPEWNDAAPAGESTP